MHAYKKKDANPQKGIDSQGISIEKTGYCRGNFRLNEEICSDSITPNSLPSQVGNELLEKNTM